MTAHTGRPAAALVALALLGTSCGTGGPAGTGAAGGTATTSAAAEVPDVPEDRVGQAHRAALGLLALGALGAEKGGTQALRALAERTTSDGRSLDEQIRALATAHGLALGDDVGAETQDVLADLETRSGPQFDQAWLRAVGVVVGQGRVAANAVLTSSTTSEQATVTARNLRARLDALATAVQRATARSEAGTPTR